MEQDSSINVSPQHVVSEPIAQVKTHSPSFVLPILTLLLGLVLGFFAPRLISYLGSSRTAVQPLPSSLPSPSINPTVDLEQYQQTSPIPTPKPIKTLLYSLPAGWQTIKNAHIPMTASYDPLTMTSGSSDQIDVLEIKKKAPNEYNPTFTKSYFYAQLRSYNGGSRHAFILNPAGEVQPGEKLASYHENEYVVDGKRCLFLIGLQISQSHPTWGICGLNFKQAVHITIDTIKDSEIETMLKTVHFRQ